MNLSNLNPKLYPEHVHIGIRRLWLVEKWEYPEYPMEHNRVLTGSMHRIVGTDLWKASVLESIFSSPVAGEKSKCFTGTYDEVIDQASAYVVGRALLEGLS